VIDTVEDGMTERAEAAWLAFVARHGLPLSAASVPRRDLEAAIDAGRVIEVRTLRDGFAGGSVLFSRVSDPNMVEKVSVGSGYRSAWDLHEWIVVPPSAEADDVTALLGELRGNWWERVNEVPGGVSQR
jgi:hypothetical protein